MKSVLYCGLICCFLVLVSVCRAENRFSPPLGEQPSKDRPELPEYLPDKEKGGIVLPPAPQIPDMPVGASEFVLAGVVFEGNTVFSDEELKAVAEPFVGRHVGLADLEELRYRLTRLYVDKGYINSGAILKPGQQIDDGIVAYSIIEGRLCQIDIDGNGRLKAGYLEKRVWPDPDRPFNTDLLRERFELLLQDPLIERMNGRILPGAEPGEAVLDLEITRERPYGISFAVDNHRPPSTGAIGGTVASWVRNLTGWGDVLDFAYGTSEGSDRIDVGYAFFLNPRDTRLALRYSYSENSVIEEPLKDIDIESESESFDAYLMHPFRRTLESRLEMGVALSVRESKTFLLDTPFSFSAGAVDGKSQVTALRAIQSYVDRTSRHALALRSTFSFGLDLFGATVNGDDWPDSRFFSWLGQVQYARRLGDKFGSLILRGDVQLSPDELLDLEQFALGGACTVRGYRENEIVRDNGFDVSVEWRYPLWRTASGDGRDRLLEIAPFMDFGAAWNRGDDPWDRRLHSAGIGLLWSGKWIDAQLYAAHNLENAASYEEHDLQDDGIYFRVEFHY